MTHSPISKEYHPDLIVEEANNGWRIVRLNRPKSLHALDESIVSALLAVFEDIRFIVVFSPILIFGADVETIIGTDVTLAE